MIELTLKHIPVLSCGNHIKSLIRLPAYCNHGTGLRDKIFKNILIISDCQFCFHGISIIRSVNYSEMSHSLHYAIIIYRSSNIISTCLHFITRISHSNPHTYMPEHLHIISSVTECHCVSCRKSIMLTYGINARCLTYTCYDAIGKSRVPTKHITMGQHFTFYLGFFFFRKECDELFHIHLQGILHRTDFGNIQIQQFIYLTE